ncbi:hypothetical protein G7K71_09400 [Desulfofundulus sp. TPOSR]|uniref:hypothetical protein n=1 Tax=Desulfofundulus sp. TPOSR TaxID=2714340 RepID=UPI001407A74C|nr:hypothetical protein [Desulfofundulus sp. TPOSR]NHM27196.1 hypothetical protein [Desulfofundulus sp. TPOSR]
MKCHVHNDIDAVATCSLCGKGLCSECASIFQPPSCSQCVLSQTREILSYRKRTLIVTAIIGALGAAYGIFLEGGFTDALYMAWVFCGIYWGWTYVRQMLYATLLGTSVTALFRPSATGVSFIVGFGLTCLAVLLGMLIGPFLFIKNAYEYIRDKKNYESLVTKQNLI